MKRTLSLLIISLFIPFMQAIPDGSMQRKRLDHLIEHHQDSESEESEDEEERKEHILLHFLATTDPLKNATPPFIKGCLPCQEENVCCAAGFVTGVISRYVLPVLPAQCFPLNRPFPLLLCLAARTAYNPETDNTSACLEGFSWGRNPIVTGACFATAITVMRVVKKEESGT